MPDARLTGWAGLGLAGSVAMTAAGPALTDGGAVGWWFTLHLPSGRPAELALFYAGLAALCIAWLGIGGRLNREPRLTPAQLVYVGVLWSVPLVLGAPLFSHDVYSYLAQGEMLHHGLNPYHHGPAVLARLGDRHLLAAVSPFWRATTSPYGPLFLALASLIAAAVGPHLILGVLLLRLLELMGLVLLAAFVPRLARALGTDPSRAAWLAVISPLVLLELIAAGHNDALMIGLLVAGVTLAMERRPLLGIALCAVAATVKLPAAAGIAFVAVAWARAEWSRASEARARAVARALGLGAAATVGMLAAVSAASGLGLSWLSSAVLASPAKVHLAITPVTAAGWTLAAALHLVGIGANARHIESAFGVVALALTVLLGVGLLQRARYANLIPALGTLLLVLVFAGPATWPWYLTWGLALIACCAFAQRSRALPVGIVVAVLVVKPNGILALPLRSAPIVLAVYAIVAVAVWQWRRPRRATSRAGTARGRGTGERPALTGS